MELIDVEVLIEELDSKLGDEAYEAIQFIESYCDNSKKVILQIDDSFLKANSSNEEIQVCCDKMQDILKENLKNFFFKKREFLKNEKGFRV